MLRNQIINYFAVPSFNGDGVRVIRSKFTISPNEGKSILKLLSKKGGTQLPPGNILQICYDVDSGIVYTPNAYDFSKEQLDDLMQSVKYRIAKDFGGHSNRPSILSNPFESLRVRSLDSFVYAKKLIYGNFDEELPIIEANLSTMPETIGLLPKIYEERSDFWGGYIGKEVANVVSFIDESQGVIHQQKTPFVLINTSKRRGATEKEWVILNSYNEHLRSACPYDEDAGEYTIKRLLYMGWSLEEVSSVLLRDSNSIVNLFDTMNRLSEITNPEGSYYITFEKTDKFPISLDKIWNKNSGLIDVDVQFPHLRVIDYDLTNSHVILESAFYIPEDVCRRVFSPNGSVFISKYNNIFDVIDVKSGKSSERQMSKISGLISDNTGREGGGLKFSDTDRARGAWASNPLVFNVRMISDYGYATDFIKGMCDYYKVPFNDFKVVVGPIESLFGRGTQGGFMDLGIFKANDMSIPFHLVDDIYIDPPVIFVNSVQYPSYPEQTEVLIHEYRHYIYCIMNPDYEIGYDMPNGNSGWEDYLSDPNEVEAHKAEVGFLLRLGKTSDEIIREKVGGEVTKDNYEVAVRFYRLVREVMDSIEIEEELNEELTGTS